MDIHRFGCEARVAAPEIKMMRHGSGEGDELPVDKDWRVDEHVLQALAARVRIVRDVEVAVLHIHQGTQRRKNGRSPTLARAASG